VCTSLCIRQKVVGVFVRFRAQLQERGRGQRLVVLQFLDGFGLPANLTWLRSLVWLLCRRRQRLL
jgi:hypothetical protein